MTISHDHPEAQLISHFWRSAAVVALVIFASGSANAGTYIPVPMVPNAASQIVFSINNHNTVAGSFRDSADVEHGFFGPLDGSNYTVFDFPGEGTTGTEARYIGDNGVITGIALNPKFKVGEEFYRSPNGKFKTFKRNGKPLDGIARGLNDDGTSVGDYVSGGKTLGYIGQKGKFVEDFKLHLHGHPNFLQISPRGIDDLGQAVAGSFVDASGTQHGFMQFKLPHQPDRVEVLNYPGAKGTALQDLNNSTITGQWIDSNEDFHAFELIAVGGERRVVDLNPNDGSSSQQAWGINDHGLVALSTSNGQSYIYCPRHHPEKCPAGGSRPNITSPVVTGHSANSRPQ